MLSSRRALLLALLSTTTGAAAIQGCSTSHDDAGSSVANHTVGELLAVNDPHVWVEPPADDIVKGISTMGSTSPPVPRADPTTVRLDQWLDRFHSIATDMLAARGERLTAPKPRAAIFRVGQPNAWVSASMACPSWTLRNPAHDAGAGGVVEGGAPDAGPAPTTFFLSTYSAMVTDVSARCIEPQNWNDPNAFASFWNGRSPGCTVTAAGTDFTLGGGTSCSTSGSKAAQGRLATMAVSSTIAATIELIAWNEEARAVMTLAHELGHYYRAHTNSTVRKRLGFFYQDGLDRPEVPVPVEESDRYWAIVSEARRYPSPIKFPGKTQYNKRLAKALFSLKPLCPAAQLDETTLNVLAFGTPGPTHWAAYFAFENAIASCAPTLALTDPATKTSFDKALRDGSIGTDYPADAPTAAAALAALTSKIDVIDANAKELLTQLNTGTLGWYTEEQEADEISLDLATRAGFTPEALIAARVRSHEQADAAARAGNYKTTDLVDAATCKAWVAAGFTEKDADGVSHPIRVPIGSITDPHHESCYRIFNVWREARKHKYVVAPPLPALSPTWSSLQRHAIYDLDAVRAPALPEEQPTTTKPEGAPNEQPRETGETPNDVETSAPLPGSPDGTTKTPPAGEPTASPPQVPSTRAEGCSTAPGSHGSSAPWLVAIAALFLLRCVSNLFNLRDRSSTDPAA